MATEPGAAAPGATTLARAGWFAATAGSSTAALLLAANAADDRTLASGWAAAGFAYLGFVGLPGALSAGVARFQLSRIACFVIMTGVGFWAGWSMGSSDDAQAGLAALIVPFVGIPLAGLVLVGESVLVRRAGVVDPDPIDMRETRAALPERLASLLVDLAIAVAVLVVPLTMLSHRGAEVVAAAVGVVAGVAYLSGSWMTKGATIGQTLLRLRVVDGDATNPAPARAIARAGLLIVEILGTATLLLIPLTAVEIGLAASAGGQTLVDRLTRTTVVARGGRAAQACGPSSCGTGSSRG